MAVFLQLQSHSLWASPYHNIAYPTHPTLPCRTLPNPTPYFAQCDFTSDYCTVLHSTLLYCTISYCIIPPSKPNVSKMRWIIRGSTAEVTAEVVHGRNLIFRPGAHLFGGWGYRWPLMNRPWIWIWILVNMNSWIIHESTNCVKWQFSCSAEEVRKLCGSSADKISGRNNIVGGECQY